MRMTHLLISMAAMPLVALAAPVLAADPPAAPAAPMQTCSAKVTDNCMQRAGHAKSTTHHKGTHKGSTKGKHHGKKHHKGHEAHKAEAKAPPAKK